MVDNIKTFKLFPISKETGETIIQAIHRRQIKYFQTLRKIDLLPMVYKDIAADVSKDISTVARFVDNKKFTKNDFQIFYKDLFSEAVIPTNTGEYVTQEVIYDKIIRLVEKEDKNRPLTDNDIQAKLQQLGYQIARRTIAKYRDTLNIPNSNIRKSMFKY